MRRALALIIIGLLAIPLAAQADPDVCGGTHLDPGDTHNGTWGTITSGKGGVDYDLATGWTATICVKAGSEQSGGGTDTVTVSGAGHVASPGGHDLSHWSVIATTQTTTTTDPTMPDTTIPEETSSTITTVPDTTTTTPTTSSTTTTPSSTSSVPPSSTTSTTSATPTTTPAPSTTAPTPSSTVPATTPDRLPETGVGSGLLALAASAMLGTGWLSVRASKRDDLP